MNGVEKTLRNSLLCALYTHIFVISVFKQGKVTSAYTKYPVTFVPISCDDVMWLYSLLQNCVHSNYYFPDSTTGCIFIKLYFLKIPVLNAADSAST